MGILETQTRVKRPPVVAVMGHIDHGKSTLLDYIRKSNTTDKEAGGITQHVSAYEVTHQKENGEMGKITFLDTPGHEAFAGIRARGATCADIGILVVSAEDGVKPQTLEAYARIKECKLPFIVAITKIDKPSANIDRAKQSLAESDVYVEGYGGSVPVVPISSKTGEGVKELLDMIFLMAELENFTGDKSKWGTGIIIESRLDAKVGITAVGIIKDGTVKKGMTVASTGTTAPLRYILDMDGKQIDKLSFSSPIQLVGWDDMPPVGDVFELFDDKKAAEFYAESEAVKNKKKKSESVINENVLALPIIIKADTTGSLEAIVYELNKLPRERIQIKVVLSGIGTVSENDVKSSLATPGTLIFSFNTKIDPQAGPLAERSGITIESFDVIYKLTERVMEILKEREPKVEVDEVTGQAKVLRVFGATKDKQVLGARAISGIIEVGSQVRILRREAEIGKGKIKELQQNKIAADKVNEGGEFGAMIESKVEIAPGDIFEAVTRVTK
ncbi:MAG: translation initiation factor IF-2 [Parcubacteria bacterium C7867-005]|nr:MAG: translation initiation factor IF-2 [Parcubacteria bacterium C7867-005]